MPRGRDPFEVVGSIEVEMVGVVLAGDLSLVKGSRRSQQRNILIKISPQLL